MRTDSGSSMGIDHLLARARSGDREAEGDLFARLQARVLSLARRRIWDPEAAGDIAQETMRTVYEKYREAELEHGLFPWVFMIFRNKVGNYLKQRRRREQALSASPEDFRDGPASSRGPAPDEEVEAIDLARSLEAAFERMSRDCRRIFQLLLEGADRRRIQVAFGGEPIGTIDSRISRCRDRLLAHLEAEGKKGGRR